MFSIATHQPKRIESAHILVDNIVMDTKKIKIQGAHVCIGSMEKVDKY